MRCVLVAEKEKASSRGEKETKGEEGNEESSWKGKKEWSRPLR